MKVRRLNFPTKYLTSCGMILLMRKYVEIDEATLLFLKNEIERTQMGPRRILRNTRGERPVDLNSGIVARWLSGHTTRAQASHLNFVLDRLASTPSVSIDARERVELSAAIIAELQGLRDQSGIGAWALLSPRPNEVPEGLHPATIQQWLDGKVKSARRDHLEFVRKRWCPDFGDDF
ncbi:MAG: hypothetical protein AAFV59_15655 [Pseudomonadota bacterium]